MMNRYLAFTCALSVVVVAIVALTAEGGGQQAGAGAARQGAQTGAPAMVGAEHGREGSHG